MSDSVKSTPFNFGTIIGTIYDFAATGDILTNKPSENSSSYFIIVAKGKVRITAGDWTYDAENGRVIDLPFNQEHRFEALEADSRIITIVKSSRLPSIQPQA